MDTQEIRQRLDGWEMGYGRADFMHHAPKDIDHLLSEVEKNKTVSCDSCGFRYGAEHITQSTGKYDCPVCEVERLEARVRELENDYVRLLNYGP